MPIYLPALDPGGLTDQLFWSIIDRFGVEHDVSAMNNRSIFVPKGTKGLVLAGVDLVTEKKPLDRGVRVRKINTNPVEISLPLVILNNSFINTLALVDIVKEWFFTGDENNLQPAYLKITRPQDNEARKILFYYNGGLEGDMDPGSPTYVPYVVKLFCPDSDWLGTPDEEHIFTQSELLDVSTVINNPGDANTNPVFRWSGPGNNAVITNEATGQTLALTANGGVSLGLNETVIMDMRPPTDRLTLPVINTSGVSLFTKVDQSISSLDMYLAPGNNSIHIVVQDTTSSSNINMTFTPRYRGVLR